MDARTSTKQKWILVALCLIMLAALLSVRVVLAPQQDSQNYVNSDASWHMMLTARALDETPASVHRYLPLVTLGADTDKNIPWPNLNADSEGNYYYTSFSPLSFNVCYAFFKITGLPLGETGIYILSSVVSTACFVLLALLLVRLLRDKLPAWLVLCASFLLYFFLPEMLHSNAMVFWAQSLWQLVFLAQLNVYLNLRQKGGTGRYILFFALALLSCMTEWTGYVANVGFAAVAFFGLFGKTAKEEGRAGAKKRWGFSAGLAGCCVAALALFLLRFSAVMPLGDLLESLTGRMDARAGSRYRLLDLLWGYWDSFHWFWVLLGLLTLLALLLPAARKRYAEIFKETRGMLFVMLFPLLENLLLMNHASAYTYDRMKAVIPLILLFLYAVYALASRYAPKGAAVRAMLLTVLVGLSVVSLWRYDRYGMVGGSRYRWEMQGYAQDYALAEYVNANFDPDESLLGMESSVRGWATLCFGRGIYEHSVDSEMIERAVAQGKRYVIIMVVQDNGEQWDKDVYPVIKIFDTETGGSKIIPVSEMDNIDPRRIA